MVKSKDNKDNNPINAPMLAKAKIAALASKIKDLDALRTEYELFDDNLTPNIILQKFSETSEFYLKILQQIMQPEDFNSLHEANAFDDLQKSKLMDLYKDIIILHRELLKAQILSNDDNSIRVIQLARKELEGFKPVMVDIIDKIQKLWKSDSKIGPRNDSMRYFG